MPWLVMRFVNTDEVEALPQNWYDNEKQIVYYPSFPRQQLQKAIKNEVSPDVNTWVTYKVTLMKTKSYINYQEACRKATIACTMSDLSTSEEIDLPAKRIIKKKYISDFDSERSDSEESLQDTPACPRQSRAEKEKPTSGYRKTGKENVKPAAVLNYQKSDKETQEVTDILKNGRQRETEQILDKDAKGHELLDGEAKFKQIMSGIIKQKKILKDHEEKLDTISRSLDEIKILLAHVLDEKDKANENIPTKEIIIDIFENLPISCSEDFDKIESFLEDKNTRNKFIEDMRRLGGSSYKECSRRFMRKILVDDLAKLYSLHGHKGKQVFAKTRLFSAVIDAILMCDKDTNAKKVEIVIGQWLAKATERLQKKGNEAECRNVDHGLVADGDA